MTEPNYRKGLWAFKGDRIGGLNVMIPQEGRHAASATLTRALINGAQVWDLQIENLAPALSLSATVRRALFHSTGD